MPTLKSAIGLVKVNGSKSIRMVGWSKRIIRIAKNKKVSPIIQRDFQFTDKIEIIIF